MLFQAAWRVDGVEQTQGMVARVQPDGPGVFRDYDLHKEATVIKALADHTPVPAPKVFFYEEDPAILGAPFLVMERIDGRIPADDPPFTATGWVLELDPRTARQIFDNGSTRSPKFTTSTGARSGWTSSTPRKPQRPRRRPDPGAGRSSGPPRVSPTRRSSRRWPG